MKIIKSISFIIASALISMTAYAQDFGGQNYGMTETRRVQQLEVGTIEAMRSVTVDDTSTMSNVMGGGLGGLIGGVLGNKIGNGSGRLVATAVLATVGAVGGTYATNAVMKKQGIEYVVTMDDGRTIAVVQEPDSAYPLSIGDRVRLVYGQSVKVAKL